MVRTGKAKMHPVVPLLLQYTNIGCPIDVGTPWLKGKIMTATKRGAHKSAMVLEAMDMMLNEVKGKEKLVEIVYFDELEHLFGTLEWEQLKLSPLAMMPHKS